ncbi:MAG: DUF4313 domain-containing protein [Lachnospiraceae bacterium]|nr:DUF4313 domain-containing protein [Lachnospiraceae bacterium]
MQDNVKKAPFKSYFGEEMVSLRVNSYYYGNGLHIGLTSYSEYGPEPFADMTVNLKGYSLRPNEAFINGDGSDKFLQFIKENKLGIVFPYKYSSGYGSYAKVSFDLDRLQEFDPVGVAEFKEKHHIPEKKETVKKSRRREPER